MLPVNSVERALRSGIVIVRPDRGREDTDDDGSCAGQAPGAAAGNLMEALDNGFLACADPAALQAICDSLSADDIQDFFDRWV